MQSIKAGAVGLMAAGAFCGSVFGARMAPCGEAWTAVVQDAPGYNSWPMVQALGGGRVVCAYSRGSAHTIDEGKRGVYARTSADGGRTWGGEVCVADDPAVGEVTVGKGLDGTGAMLLWVRRWGRQKGHDLYRTVDGARFEKLASPALSPMPMQVTDVFAVPGKGLMSLWFAGSYGNKTGGHSWGTLTSADGGRTWTQRTVEADLSKADWPTEQSAVHLGGGRILAVARSEGGTGAQFQLTSTDGGDTWKRSRTNIADVRESTPSLIYDPATGLVANNYYHRGAKKLKRRVADAAFIFGHPAAWPAPETLAEGDEARAWDAGNVNATVCGDRHLLALYTGTTADCTVFAVSVPVPSATAARTYVMSFDVSNASATSGVANVSLPGVVLFDSALPPPGGTKRFARAFRTVAPMAAAALKPGLWNVSGKVTVGRPSLEAVTPVHDAADGLEMGSGERLFGRTYRYSADWYRNSGNATRPFTFVANGHLHDSHWRMRGDGALLMRHTLGGRRFTEAKLTVNVSYADTPWAVEASADGGEWRRLATFPKSETGEVTLPDGADIRVCVCGAGDKGFRICGYSFEAKVDDAPSYRIGRTDFRRADGSLLRWPDMPEKPYAQGSRLESTDGALRLWTAAAGWKVFPENPLPPETARTDAVRIQTAANEAECAQLVVTPARTLEGVRVEVAEMKGMPPSSVEVLKVSCVDVRVPTDRTCAPGLWPDPIERQTAEGCRAAADESLAFWVRVKPPKGTPPGVCRGVLELRADGCAPQRVPLEVEVFGFELPDTMTCETAFGCGARRISRVCRLKTDEDRRRALPEYFRILGEHHISVYDPNPTTPLKVTWKGLKDPATAEPSFNWDEWDAGVERSLKEWHMNTVRVPVKGLGGGTYQGRLDPQIAGFKGGTPEYEALMGRYLGAIEAHLREKGWLGRSYVYWFDEPDPKDYEFVSNGFAHLKRYAPGIRRMLTEQVEPELMDGVNLWCPVSHNLHRTDRTAALARGDTFWWYVCCGPKAPYATEFVDKPGTELRVWLWQTWKEGIAGVLIWETVYWDGGCVYRDRTRPQDCWEDPQSWCDSRPVGWGNGDGRFLYPPRAARDRTRSGPVLDPPVETYRLEMLRDGLEDYEYLAVLRRLDPSNALLAVPPEVTASMTEFTRDPAPIARRREAVAREIARLLNSRRNDS